MIIINDDLEKLFIITRNIPQLSFINVFKKNTLDNKSEIKTNYCFFYKEIEKVIRDKNTYKTLSEQEDIEVSQIIDYFILIGNYGILVEKDILFSFDNLLSRNNDLKKYLNFIYISNIVRSAFMFIQKKENSRSDYTYTILFEGEDYSKNLFYNLSRDKSKSENVKNYFLNYKKEINRILSESKKIYRYKIKNDLTDVHHDKQSSILCDDYKNQTEKLVSKSDNYLDISYNFVNTFYYTAIISKRILTCFLSVYGFHSVAQVKYHIDQIITIDSGIDKGYLIETDKYIIFFDKKIKTTMKNTTDKTIDKPQGVKRITYDLMKKMVEAIKNNTRQKTVDKFFEKYNTEDSWYYFYIIDYQDKKIYKNFYQISQVKRSIFCYMKRENLVIYKPVINQYTIVSNLLICLDIQHKYVKDYDDNGKNFNNISKWIKEPYVYGVSQSNVVRIPFNTSVFLFDEIIEKLNLIYLDSFYNKNTLNENHFFLGSFEVVLDLSKANITYNDLVETPDITILEVEKSDSLYYLLNIKIEADKGQKIEENNAYVIKMEKGSKKDNNKQVFIINIKNNKEHIKKILQDIRVSHIKINLSFAINKNDWSMIKCKNVFINTIQGKFYINFYQTHGKGGYKDTIVDLMCVWKEHYVTTNI